MRYLFTIIAVFICGVSVYADSFFRCDLYGKSNGVKLIPTQNEGELKTLPPSWLKEEDRVFSLTVSSPKLGDEWQTVKFSFKTEGEGAIALNFMAQYSKDVQSRGWILTKDIAVNGKMLPNGDLKKVTERNGKPIPVGFNLSGTARLIEEDGAPAAVVNHDNRLTHSLKVEANTAYTIELKVKAGTPPAKD